MSSDVVRQAQSVQSYPLTSQERKLFSTILDVIAKIQPQQRTQVVVPRTLSHDNNGDMDWVLIKDIQMCIRDCNLKPNVFATLRFNQDETADVIVDVCYLSEPVKITIVTVHI